MHGTDLTGLPHTHTHTHTHTEVEKVWQPGNLVARKFLKNQALAESFWIFLLHFLTSKQFVKSIKEMIPVFLENVHISY